MRILLVHYKNIVISYHSEDRLVERTYNDAFTFYFSFEIGDTHSVISEFLDIVTNFEGPVTHRILFPYAHLTTRQLNVHESRHLFRQLQDQSPYDVMPFGIPKGVTSSHELESANQHFWSIKGFPDVDKQGRDVYNMIFNDSPSELLQRLYLQESRSIQFDQQLFREELNFPDISNETISERGQYTLGPRATTFLEVLNNYFVNRILELPFRVDHISGAEWFDITNSAVAAHLQDFGGLSHSYLIETPSICGVLRHAACYQAFSYLSKRKYSPNNLPRGILEVATCFRNEKKGELTPLYRTTRFSMADLHVVASREEYQKVFLNLFNLIERVRNETGLGNYIPMICYRDINARNMYTGFLSSIFPEHLESIKESEGVYWAFNIELHLPGRNANSKMLELATIQLDELNPTRFGIKTTTNIPLIAFHVAVMGSTERAAYILSQEGIPFFLAPEQIRIIVAKESQYNLDLLSYQLRNFRYVIDTRNKSNSRRGRQAFEENIPVIISLELDNSIRVLRGPIKSDSLEVVIDHLNTLTNGITLGRRLHLNQ